MIVALAMPADFPTLLDPLAETARRAQRGERGAFDELYRDTVGGIFALVLRLVGFDQPRAEELTQEVYLKAWQSLAQFRFEAKLSTWLHRLALNHVLGHLRAKAPLASELDESLADESALRAARAARARIDLEKLIAQLPPRARTVLVLFELEGLSHEEIAANTGMAVGSSKAQLHRARGLLKRMVGGHSDE
jgi:RNA polymerase sigma factor (sigma-70 family)